jgi:hypothetical protein
MAVDLGPEPGVNCTSPNGGDADPSMRDMETVAAHSYFHTRSAVMLMSSVPWQAPLRISVCMVPESDPSGWGV